LDVNLRERILETWPSTGRKTVGGKPCNISSEKLPHEVLKMVLETEFMPIVLYFTVFTGSFSGIPS
jgi:hypothetical protein